MLTEDGYEIVSTGLSPEDVVRIGALGEPAMALHAGKGGIRDAVRAVPALRPVVAGVLQRIAARHLGPECFAVRVLLFDKTRSANWKATWHQDVTIAVTEYRDVPGWGPWSRKDGVWHVRPPAEVLEAMLTVRLHLDPCGPDNGPVRVLPGTHTLGRLGDAELERAVRGPVPVDCLLPAGGALLMRPLLLHSSAPAGSPSRRRVLHAEFASRDLPDGFRWAERIAGEQAGQG